MAKAVIKYLLCIVCAVTVVQASPPHRRLANEEYEKLSKREEEKKQQNESPNSVNLEDLGIEYQRYLQQVIETLESDELFKKKLESADETDIRSGKIAEELEYVSHHVRSKLDELKRIELDRLRQLAKKQHELAENEQVPSPGHLDHNNPHSFEKADLQKLIYKVAEDLQEADRKRKELFKEYEMQKHYELDQKLSSMTEEERKKFKKQQEEKELLKKDNKKKVHHPGSKKQLEEVWEKDDHLDKSDFDPKVFFAMHDLDNNGFLDEEEIKALFINELNKLYPKSDLVERDEELERMREHVFNEIDLNKDRLISWEEFYRMSLQPEFNQDPGWKPLDEQPVYTPEELAAFERDRQATVQRLVQEGKIYPPEGPAYHYPPNDFMHPEAMQYPQGYPNPAGQSQLYQQHYAYPQQPQQQIYHQNPQMPQQPHVQQQQQGFQQHHQLPQQPHVQQQHQGFEQHHQLPQQPHVQQQAYQLPQMPQQPQAQQQVYQNQPQAQQPPVPAVQQQQQAQASLHSNGPAGPTFEHNQPAQPLKQPDNVPQQIQIPSHVSERQHHLPSVNEIPQNEGKFQESLVKN